MTVIQRTVDGLYGMTAAYRADLTILLRQLGANVYTGGARFCTDKLHNRHHRCHHDYDRRNWFHIDHDVLLRWPDGAWGLLAQPYPDASHTDLEAAAEHGLTIVDLGRAPYGNGTVGYLIVGTDRPSIGGTR